MLGSYVRNYSIDRLISQFLNPESRKQQIISLGAGSDTRPFKLLKEHANLLYHELDFGVSTAHKARVIHNNVDMKRIVDLENGDCDFEKGEIHTRNYHLHPTDLRMIKNNGEFTLPGIDRDSESLIVSECCLCYLEPHESENVLNWIIQSFPNVGIILYEPVGGTDNFGVVMMQNLASRGISLPTLHKYPTLQSQVIRLKDLGFTNASASDMEYIHDHWLPSEEKLRLDKLEVLDEREEMNLLLRHYCLVWAGNGTCWTGWHSSSHNS